MGTDNEQRFKEYALRDDTIHISLRYIAPDVGQDGGHVRHRGDRIPGFEVGVNNSNSNGAVDARSRRVTFAQAETLARVADALVGHEHNRSAVDFVVGIRKALPGAIDRALERATGRLAGLRELRAALTGEVAQPADDDLTF